MIIVSFSIEDEEEKSCFLEETFLLTDISIDVALEMRFLILNNFGIDFAGYYFY